MKKYLLKRILFSIFALFVVTGTVMTLVYNLIDRSTVLANDSVYSRKTDNERTTYGYTVYKRYGYIDYITFSSWIADELPDRGEDYDEAVAAVQAKNVESEYPENQYCVTFANNYKSAGYKVEWLKPKFNRKGAKTSNGYLVATRDRNVFQRLGDYVANFISIDTIWNVQDAGFQGERYLRWEWDPYSNMPALVGNGTRHRYLIYFDDQFPFIHQNFIHFNLGASRDYGVDTSEVLLSRTGDPIVRDEIAPISLYEDEYTYVKTNYDFHTVTYSANPNTSEAAIYGADNHYINAGVKKDGFTHMGNSFFIGLLALIIAYILGLPIGILMARKKEKLADKLGNMYVIFIIAVPSLAYIFMFAALGVSVFKLPYKWQTAEVRALAFILPTISLALPSIAGLMRWVRRFMIDQENADYVKFARSQGLTEREIFSKHIFRNAFIFLVHGVPADILACLVGAIITEKVYGVPGIGGLLTNAINTFDNGVIVAATVFYTVLSITALLLGDLLLAKYDPRVSFTDDRR